MGLFHKAERKKAKLRLAVFGPSGSGKTYSALQIAQGLGSKIALVDTENGSGELYSNLCDYDVAPIAPPFTPKKYIDVINAAQVEGYEVLIIDSLSHAWAGEGGMLDMHNKATQASRSKNSYMAWRQVTPEHNKLIDKILQSNMHVIVTARTKVAYEVQDDGRGKKAPVKVGLAPVFREGLDYEMTTVFELSVEGHIAQASKDRTGLFDGQMFTPNAETGETLRAWLEDGVEVPHISDEQKAEVLDLLGKLGINTDDATAALAPINQWRKAAGLRPVEEIDEVLEREATKMIACMQRSANN